MSVGYLELFLEQGEAFSANVTLDSVNGSIYDLNNYEAKSQIRKSYWSANTSAEFVANVVGDLGIISISLDANTTQTLTSSRYVFDIFIVDVSDQRYRSKVLEGLIFVQPSATKF